MDPRAILHAVPMINGLPDWRRLRPNRSFARPGQGSPEVVVAGQVGPSLGESLVEGSDDSTYYCRTMKTSPKIDWVEWAVALSLLSILTATAYAVSMLSA
jgi:hypothetical protein